MKNGILLVSLFSIFFLISLNNVTAFTVTLDSPIANGVLYGNNVTDLNITISPVAEDILNCTAFLSSPSTANLTDTEIGFYPANSSADAFNDTLSSFYLGEFQDAPDYSMKASCTNSSNDNANSTTTTVQIDYTAPDTPSSLSPISGTIDKDGDVTFSGTINDTSTISCVIVHGVNHYPVTQSTGATSCSKSLTRIPEQSYNWYIIASDGINLTRSSSLDLKIDTSNTGKKAAAMALIQQPGVESKGGALLAITREDRFTELIKGNYLWILAIIVIATGIFFWKRYK